MSMVGGNLEELDGLQRSFVAEAATVSALLARVSAVVRSTTWVGPAADAFRSQWEGQFAPALGSLRTGLEDQARVVASRRAAIASATS